MSLPSFFRRERSGAQGVPGGGDPLERFRRGDAGAFDELVGAFAPGIVRLFRRHGADPATAEDLAQEVFVRLIKSRAPYESQGRLQVYLYRIARNVWLDWRRTRAGRPGRTLDVTNTEMRTAAGQLLVCPAIGPADLIAGRDAARVLSALLKRLPDGERLVLELSLFDNMRYADVANALGIPEGTVKSRVFHGLRRLRAWSAEMGVQNE